MNRRRNPEQLPPYVHVEAWLRALAFAGLWSALIFADAIAKALSS